MYTPLKLYLKEQGKDENFKLGEYVNPPCNPPPPRPRSISNILYTLTATLGTLKMKLLLYMKNMSPRPHVRAISNNLYTLTPPLGPLKVKLSHGAKIPPPPHHVRAPFPLYTRYKSYIVKAR